MMTRTLLLITGLFLLFSCSEDTQPAASDQPDTSSLPGSNGAIGEVLLVMDTNHLSKELGQELEDLFLQPYPGLPQAELPFDITRIHYAGFNGLFERHKTILFAIPFSSGGNESYMADLIGDAAVKKVIEKNREILDRENVFAKDQQIIFLFGQSQRDIAKTLRERGQDLLAMIDNREEERLKKELYSVGERKDMAEKLKNELGFKVRIPRDYMLVKGTEDFTWLRLAREDVDYNIIVSERPYTSESQFDSTYIAEWRDELGQHIKGEDTSFVKVIQQLYPIDTKIIPDPIYIREDRGLWKLTSNLVGGPFLSRVRVGNSGRELYYIEAFVIAPGRDKREFMREMEVILSTFEG